MSFNATRARLRSISVPLNTYEERLQKLIIVSIFFLYDFTSYSSGVAFKRYYAAFEWVSLSE